MSGRKILIDTNVFIGLEDQKEVPSNFAKLQQLCGQHSVRVFVHEAAGEDIRRDRSHERRKISLSKVKKFEQLAKVKLPAQDELSKHFGPITKPNDSVDLALLYALRIGSVDILVTQDEGIHVRARRCSPPLADRVLTVADTVAWLSSTYEPKEVRLPLVEEVPAHAIPLDDEIFESPRERYPEFDRWWREKCIPNHRQCWAATVDDELVGLVVRKDESHAEACTRHIGPKILKICTFTVKQKFRGERLGELLLKQILWFASKNSYDLVYLTTFSDQIFLIQVIEYFGFQKTGVNSFQEEIYEKPLSRARLEAAPGDDIFELARNNYPRFVARPPACAFCVPIKGEYHNMLFPELSTQLQGDLFHAAGLAVAGRAPRTPGNTIRKVYLCRAQTNALARGNILLFYRSKSPDYLASQSATSIGVVEAVSETSNLDDLIRLTTKRSVYSTQQLQAILTASSKRVKVIDFLLIGHLDPVVPLVELNRDKVFSGHPPQSICSLSPDRFKPILRRINFGFEV